MPGLIYPRQEATGVAKLFAPDGKPPVKFATFTCNHCSHVTELAGKDRPADAGAICKTCMHPICLRCAAARARGEKCDPWDAKLARAEASYEARRSYGI